LKVVNENIKKKEILINENQKELNENNTIDNEDNNKGYKI
jgi:hypothetical protein